MILWTVLFLALVGIATIVANRANAPNPLRALAHLSGWWTSFGGMLALLLVVLPLILYYGPRLTRDYYTPVVNQTFGDDLSQAGATAKRLLAPAGSNGEGGDGEPVASAGAEDGAADPNAGGGIGGGSSHTVVPGETLRGIADQHGVAMDALAAANGIVDVDRITTGQVLLIPEAAETPAATATPTTPEASVSSEATAAPGTAAASTPATTSVPATSTPLPTATRDLSVSYASIEENKKIGQRNQGQLLVEGILLVAPEAERAQTYKAELEAADLKIRGWNELGKETTEGWFFYAASSTDFIAEMLAGYKFYVVGVEETWFARKWEEAAIVKCVSEGWLYGVEVTLARGHLDAFGVDRAGGLFQCNQGAVSDECFGVAE